MDIGFKLKKFVRTVQSEMPFLKELKDSLYLHGRNFFAAPTRATSGCWLPFLTIWQDATSTLERTRDKALSSIKIVKPNASVVSFEANPGLAAKLARRYAGWSDIDVRPFGLGNENADAILYTPVYNGFVYDALGSFNREYATDWISPSAVYGFDPKKLEIREFSLPGQASR